MNTAEAKELIADNIAHGRVDARTHEFTARAVVTHFEEHPRDRAALRRALVAVIQGYEWTTNDQVENAAYLAVNLSVSDAVKALITGTSTLEDPAGEYATPVVSAIRSYPQPVDIRGVALPALFQWLRRPNIAPLAFEALCDISPEDAGAFYCVLAQYHRDDSAVLERALTHLFHMHADEQAGVAEVTSVVDAFLTTTGAIEAHPFLPDSLKMDVRRKLSSEDSARDEPAVITEPFLPDQDWARARRAQNILVSRGAWAPVAVAV